MIVRESVIDIAGVVWSTNLMTIDHSDVKAVKTDGDEVGKLPYRVYSKTGIELIREKNGEVKKGLLRGDDVWFVDTDDNDGENVDLKADGEPAYYKCADDDSDKSAQAKAMPKTGDGINPFLPTTALAASIVAVAFAARRREEQ